LICHVSALFLARPLLSVICKHEHIITGLMNDVLIIGYAGRSEPPHVIVWHFGSQSQGHNMLLAPFKLHRPTFIAAINITKKR